MKLGRRLLLAIVLVAGVAGVFAARSESVRSFVGWGEHCGCKAAKGGCAMPCSACCSPGTCTVTQDPTGRAQRCACARGSRP